MIDLNTRARKALQRLHEAGRIRSPWLRGMVAVDECGVNYLIDQECGVASTVYSGPIRDDMCPDTTVTLTVMGLLLLLREATGDPGMHVVPDDTLDWWWLYDRKAYGPHGSGSTEAEAIVAALEAAAGRTP